MATIQSHMSHFVTIHYLRAVAAVLVVVYHVGLIPPGRGLSFVHGQAGVDIFFVISGFVMYVSGRHLKSADFFRRRLLRIVPLYWSVTFFLAFVSFRGGVHIGLDQPLSAVVRSIFFIPYVNPGADLRMTPILHPGWTLNLEMAFYLVFALTLIVARSRLVVTLVAILSIAVLTGLLLPDNRLVADFYLQSIVGEFAFGLLIGAAAMSGHLAMRPTVAVAVMLSGALWILATVGAELRVLTWGVGAALIVTGFVALEPVLSKRPVHTLNHLGDASYALYLTHVVSIAVAGRLFTPVVGRSSLALEALTVAFCLLAGSAVHLAYEKPLQRRLSALLRSSSGASTAASNRSRPS